MVEKVSFEFSACAHSENTLVIETEVIADQLVVRMEVANPAANEAHSILLSPEEFKLFLAKAQVVLHHLA